ncbi:hypothetical protein [Modestobacter excelsi]|uniref:hypothetical protein n=1 Tax=Modestobacter excelsi TaxID=2213161 RepID=UPI001C20EE73|nr:hypothetical protein [Modestobacter excelsi]
MRVVMHRSDTTVVMSGEAPYQRNRHWMELVLICQDRRLRRNEIDQRFVSARLNAELC